VPAAELLAAGTAMLDFPVARGYGPHGGQLTAVLEMDDYEQAQAAGRQYIIKRPRLTRLLDESESRILMLVAPAGYGKTTLAREWLEERRHAWYRGTTASADVAALAVGIAEATRPLIPGAGERMQDRLRATGTPEQDVQPLAELLAEDLEEWPDDAWLALDDYQFACESEFSERFVNLLLQLAPIRLILTSRVRPKWATAKRLLYGELHELGQNLLAMDRDEAIEVLGRGKGTAAAGLVALADGWPAVIGLAALAEGLEPPDAELPDTLYEYFADELYQAASPELQSGLCLLALAPSMTSELAAALLGEMSSTVTGEGLRLGFLTSPARGVFEVHPLLRVFLEARFRERSGDEAADAAGRLGRFLIERAQWDDAFALLERFFTDDVFASLLEVALPSLVREGRLPTLARWVEVGEQHRIDSPVLDLAEAEIAFRHGDRDKAEVLAARAGRQLGSLRPLASRAFWLAGTSAYMRERLESAFQNHSRALDIAHSDSDRRAAACGRVLVAAKLEHTDTEFLLSQLDDLDDGSPESTVQLLGARFLVETRLGLGDPSALLADYQAGLHLLPKLRDPVSRTALVSSYSQLLVGVGRYEEALAAAQQTAVEGRDARLGFVEPYSLLVQAIAETGLRHFRRASQLIDRVDDAGAQLGDTYLSIEAQILRTRLFLAEGQFERALLPQRLHNVPPAPGEAGELLAWEALAHACAGSKSQALALAGRAERLTHSPEARIVVSFVRAISALNEESPDATTHCNTGFNLALQLGGLDFVVGVYRAHPPLLQILSQTLTWHARLAQILSNARDWKIAKELGLPFDVARRNAKTLLSRREQEVHNLLAQGLSNKEIARLLYISDATVKVHVRHIFEKLGVKTRVEAALRAASLEEDQATSANGSPE
jgi:ATP/maltotriose-dependent transcriptional regulator MalT